MYLENDFLVWINNSFEVLIELLLGKGKQHAEQKGAENKPSAWDSVR